MAELVGLVLQAIYVVINCIDTLELLSTQAARLAKRIGALKEPVAAIRNSRRSYPNLALRQLLEIIQESKTFLDDFQQMSTLMRIYNKGPHRRKFDDLSARIADIVQTLGLGMAVSNWEAENELDRVHDMEQLLGQLERLRHEHRENHNEVMVAIEGLRSDQREERYSWTEINPDEVEFLEGHPDLGTGPFSTVRLARWESTHVAVKMMNDAYGTSPETIRALRAELRVHQDLHHDFVTHLYGACTIKPNLWLLTEYARNGSLDQYLRRSRSALPAALQVAFLSDIARGMGFLHRRKVLHRDLKSHSILVFDKDRLKLCDFRLAKVQRGNTSTAGLAEGTAAWIAPEVLNGEGATKKSDLYSFGVVSYEVMTREVPFENMEPTQVGPAVRLGRRPQLPYPSSCPRLVDLTDKCWHQDPGSRPQDFQAVVEKLETLLLHLGGDPRDSVEYGRVERQRAGSLEAAWPIESPSSWRAQESSTRTSIESIGSTMAALAPSDRDTDHAQLNYQEQELPLRIDSTSRTIASRVASMAATSVTSQASSRADTGGYHSEWSRESQPAEASETLDSWWRDIPVLSPSASRSTSTNKLNERDALNTVTWRGHTLPDWGSDAPLASWTGVKTDEESVVEVVVESSQLMGLSLTGGFREGILRLRSLRRLTLTWVSLSGPIPPEIGELTALESLHLGDNELEGSIPPQLGNLTALTELRLWRNRLSGEIPPELGKLTSLTLLKLNHNNLSGSIPSEIGDLISLEYLWLNHNKLDGEIPPGLENLCVLKSLDLVGNQIKATALYLELLLPSCSRIWI